MIHNDHVHVHVQKCESKKRKSFSISLDWQINSFTSNGYMVYGLPVSTFKYQSCLNSSLEGRNHGWFLFPVRRPWFLNAGAGCHFVVVGLHIGKFPEIQTHAYGLGNEWVKPHISHAKIWSCHKGFGLDWKCEIENLLDCSNLWKLDLLKTSC